VSLSTFNSVSQTNIYGKTNWSDYCGTITQDQIKMQSKHWMSFMRFSNLRDKSQKWNCHTHTGVFIGILKSGKLSKHFLQPVAHIMLQKILFQVSTCYFCFSKFSDCTATSNDNRAFYQLADKFNKEYFTILIKF